MVLTALLGMDEEGRIETPFEYACSETRGGNSISNGKGDLKMGSQVLTPSLSLVSSWNCTSWVHGTLKPGYSEMAEGGFWPNLSILCPRGNTWGGGHMGTRSGPPPSQPGALLLSSPFRMLTWCLVDKLELEDFWEPSLISDGNGLVSN